VVCFVFGASAAPAGNFVDLSVDLWGKNGCARRADGSLACWGSEGSDDLGNDMPMRIPAGSYRSVSVGETITCAMQGDGRASCWGESDERARPAPTTRIDAPRWIGSRDATFRWSAIPLFSPITGFDVEYQQFPQYGAGSGDGLEPDMIRWRTDTTATSGTLAGVPGSTYCARARSHDADGVASGWVGTCTTLPLDDQSMQASAGWTRLSGSRFYFGTAMRSTRRGATLTLPNVSTWGLGFLVSTCPGCGQIEVRVNGVPWSEPLSLRSSRTVDQELVLWSDNGEEGTGGTVTIEVTSSGRPVIIDGVLLGPGPDD
jgi:hypothetical protein